MFRELRRKDRALSKETAIEVMENAKYGVLSLADKSGYPYGVPLHYVMDNENILFHCSIAESHKIELLKKNSKVSFTIIETEDGIKSRSVIIFGTAKEVPEKKQFVLEQFVEKFVPEAAWLQAKSGIHYAVEHIMAFQIKCEHISGKWIDKPEGR